MRKTKEMFQTFKQAWGKSIQNVISMANEISAPKLEETLKILSSEVVKNPQCEVLAKLTLEPPPQPVVAPSPVTCPPLATPLTTPLTTPLAAPEKKLQPILEPKLVKMSRVISTQTLEPRVEKYTESKEKPIESSEKEPIQKQPIEKEVVSLDYHWNILKLMFLMHVISIVIMAFLFFLK
jgi:hypothetical protein